MCKDTNNNSTGMYRNEYKSKSNKNKNLKNKK